MSTQIQNQCRGLEIQQEHLVPCINQCNDQYCEDHEYKYRLEKPEDCAVCMEHISEQTETPLECGHWFHKQCLIETNKYICPMCRQPLLEEEIEYIFGNENFDQSQVYMNEHDFTDFDFDEILPNVGPNHDPFLEMNMNESDIETMINEIETSPRNNNFVNTRMPLNIVHPEIEEVFEDFIENTIERISLRFHNGFDSYEGDITIHILSNSIDRKIFAIAFNLQNRNINNNLNERMLNLIEHSILFTYNTFF